MLKENEYPSTYLNFTESIFHNKHCMHVTTLTWIFHTKIIEDDIVPIVLNLNKLYDRFNYEGVTIKLSKNIRRYNNESDNTRTFLNQLTFEFKDFSKKSIKLFCNGKVQITGLSSHFECIEVTELVIKWLNMFSSTSKYEHYNERIVMINVSIDTNTRINLNKLSEAINHTKINSVRSTYRPDYYPAVNVKSSNGTSMFVFHTGKCILTGISLNELKKVYQEVLLFYLKYPSIAISNNIVKEHLHNKRHSIYNSVIHGYDLKDYLSCL